MIFQVAWRKQPGRLALLGVFFEDGQGLRERARCLNAVARPEWFTVTSWTDARTFQD